MERAAIQETAASFDQLVTNALTQSSSLNRIRGLFSAAISKLSASYNVSIHDAWNGLVAARNILLKLADNANSSDEIHGYNVLLMAVRDELTVLVGEDWHSRTKSYAPYTSSFIHAAAALSAARTKAINLAGSLNLTADVLGSFTKLLSVLGN
jgi:hypothetical protein